MLEKVLHIYRENARKRYNLFKPLSSNATQYFLTKGCEINVIMSEIMLGGDVIFCVIFASLVELIFIGWEKNSYSKARTNEEFSLYMQNYPVPNKSRISISPLRIYLI